MTHAHTAHSSSSPYRIRESAISKQRTRHGRKYFGVRHGRNGFCGVLTSWQETSPYVTRYPGAVYKSFNSYREASIFADPTGNGASAVALNNIIIDATQNQPSNNAMRGDPMRVVAYIAGACWRTGMNGGEGGFGVFFDVHNPYNYSGVLNGRATNRRVAIRAAAEALCIAAQHKLVASGGVLEVRTDSTFVKDGLDFGIISWKQNDWKDRGRDEILDKDMWVLVDANREELLQQRVNIHVVKMSNPNNMGLSEASKLAFKARQLVSSRDSPRHRRFD